jgi:hypothetical protein
MLGNCILHRALQHTFRLSNPHWQSSGNVVCTWKGREKTDGLRTSDGDRGLVELGVDAFAGVGAGAEERSLHALAQGTGQLHDAHRCLHLSGVIPPAASASEATAAIPQPLLLPPGPEPPRPAPREADADVDTGADGGARAPLRRGAGGQEPSLRGRGARPGGEAEAVHGDGIRAD